MLVRCGVEKDPRVLGYERGQDDHSRLLHLSFLVSVVILDGSNSLSARVGQHARYGAVWPDLGAVLEGLGKIGDQGICERAGWAARVTPAVIDAGWPPFELDTIDRKWCRHHRHSEGVEAFHPYVRMAEGLQWRHGVSHVHRGPTLLSLSVARHSPLEHNLVGIGCE